MTKPSQIARHPPAEIEETLRTLGRNIRTARLRRGITQSMLAERLGVTRTLVSRVEAGNPKPSVAVYLGALWALGLLADLDGVAEPDNDAAGKALERLHGRVRARQQRRRLSDDF